MRQNDDIETRATLHFSTRLGQRNGAAPIPEPHTAFCIARDAVTGDAIAYTSMTTDGVRDSVFQTADGDVKRVGGGTVEILTDYFGKLTGLGDTYCEENKIPKTFEAISDRVSNQGDIAGLRGRYVYTPPKEKPAEIAASPAPVTPPLVDAAVASAASPA